MAEHSFSVNSVIRGYHIYKEGWNAPVGQVLFCEREIGNCSDPSAVAVKRVALGATTFVASGHVPHFISAICSVFYVEEAQLSVQ